jgi:hypothetical protein
MASANSFLMSAEHYDWLVAAAQRTTERPTPLGVIIDSVERAEMDPGHASPDELRK